MPIDQNIINIAVLALGGLIGILLVWIIWLELRLKRIFRGGGMKDMESLLSEITRDIEHIRERLHKDNSDLRVLEKELGASVRHVGIVKFNAFNEAGGNQSFAYAILNDNKDGIVISSLHNREANRVYAKQLKNALSEHPLSREEREAIERALTRES